MEATGITVTIEDITNFQERGGMTSSSRFTSQDVSSMSIFDPRKFSNAESLVFTSYGDSSIGAMIKHYGEDWEAEIVALKESPCHTQALH